MAEPPATLKEMIEARVKPMADEVPQPFTAGAQIAYAGLISAVDGLEAFLDKPISIPIPDLGSAAETAAGVAAALSPINTTDALKEIAKAVSEAEKALNGQNLAVLNGKVNVQLVVKVGELAGAHANFDLAIGPAPQG